MNYFSQSAKKLIYSTRNIIFCKDRKKIIQTAIFRKKDDLKKK